MSYRGMGGYVSRSPPIVRRARAGDFLDDFSLGGDWGFGGFDLADTASTAIVPSGGGGFLDTLGGVWDDVSSFVGSGLGSSILSGVAKGATSLFSGSPSAAGAASTSSNATLKQALKAVNIGGRHGRRMNPGNFKALRRSMRRLTAFERAAKRVLHFTHPSRTARVKFKFPRRRRKR